jgi:hypothetical protein
MNTDEVSSIYDKNRLLELAEDGYIFLIDHEQKSVEQVLDYVKAHILDPYIPDSSKPDVILTVPKSRPTPGSATIDVPLKVAHTSELKTKSEPAAVKVSDNSASYIVTYTRYIENGKFDKTYDQVKTMKTFELAKAFLDKKILQKSRFWAGATISCGEKIVYSVDVEYRIDDYREEI